LLYLHHWRLKHQKDGYGISQTLNNVSKNTASRELKELADKGVIELSGIETRANYVAVIPS